MRNPSAIDFRLSAEPRDAFLLDKNFDLHAHTLAFVYVPGENDGGGAYLGHFVRNDGTMLILR